MKREREKDCKYKEERENEKRGGDIKLILKDIK